MRPRPALMLLVGLMPLLLADPMPQSQPEAEEVRQVGPTWLVVHHDALASCS